MEENKSTQYGKIATAISNMQKQGAHIARPLINEADFGFSPDEKNNRIIFGLKGINGIGDDIARLLIENRPYTNMEDFKERIIDTGLIKPAQMVKLIKAGCFVELDNPDPRVTMEKYIRAHLLTPTEKLTFQQFNRMLQFDMVPQEMQLLVRVQNFKKYVLSDQFLHKLYIDPSSKRVLPKCGYNDRHFKLDDISMSFFQEHFTEDSVVKVVGESFVISEKLFIKEVDRKLVPMVQWFNEEETVNKYNDCQFQELWNKHGEGTTSKWEMDSLSFYYSDHELTHLNESLYSVADFFQLPEEPVAYDYYVRYIKGERKEIDKYTITRIAGTVLDSDKNKHTISLLTKQGVVSVKFNRGQFSHYSQTISDRITEGSDKKTVLENSWFKRGNKLMICGYRQEQVFRAYKYTDTIFQHVCAKIEEINDDGTVLLNTERIRVES